jgi:hypothetical protein
MFRDIPIAFRKYTLWGWLIVVTFAPETVNKSNTIKKN